MTAAQRLFDAIGAQLILHHNFADAPPRLGDDYEGEPQGEPLEISTSTVALAEAGGSWRLPLRLAFPEDSRTYARDEHYETVLILISVSQLSTTLGTKLDRSTRIIEGMRGLPLEWQMALELRYGESLKLTEVAGAMEMSLAQVKRYIKDGLAKMRELVPGEADRDDEALGERLGEAYRS